MSDALILYTNPMSRGRIVRWMLEEVGQPYDTEVVFYGEVMKSPGFRAINPMGKVPVLVHGERIITECAAICAYLAGPVEAAVTNHALGFVAPEERQAMVGYGSFEVMQDTLEAAVQGKTFIAGDRLTAADVYVGSQIGFGLQFGTLDRRPAFEAYWASLAARPAYTRANDIDNALMPASDD
jgi:glutathione S-transferase